MLWLRNHLIAVVLVAGATLSIGGLVAFARPTHRQPDQRQVDLARAHHYSPAEVRQAFAAEGIRLRYTSATSPMIWLSTTPFPVPVTGLYVLLVRNQKGIVAWGPKRGSEYDQPVGNLDMHYGSTDGRTLAAVKAAVSRLK